MSIDSDLLAPRLTGAAALGYVALAGVENMGVLRMLLSGAGAAEIRAVYADKALGSCDLGRGRAVAGPVLRVRGRARLAAPGRGRWRSPAGWAGPLPPRPGSPPELCSSWGR